MRVTLLTSHRRRLLDTLSRSLSLIRVVHDPGDHTDINIASPQHRALTDAQDTLIRLSQRGRLGQSLLRGKDRKELISVMSAVDKEFNSFMVSEHVVSWLRY